MKKFFKLEKSGTTFTRELIAGMTTFFTMVYIIFVNPNILSQAGMSWGGVFVATIIASAVATLVMGLVANVPYALAPGMGLNAFFTYTICGSFGFTWQEALAMVFICGLVNVVITVTKVRKSIIKSIPETLQHAIGGSIGIFIAYIGIKNSGFLTFTADPGTYVDAGGTIIADSSIVPALAEFNTPGVLLALIGLIIMVVLIVLKVKGSIFIGIILTTIIGIFFGVVDLTNVNIFDLSSLGGINETAFALFGNPGLLSLFSSPEKIVLSLTAIFAFCLSDTFDTIGTFIGTGRVSGIFDEDDEKALVEGKGFKSKMDKALFADATGTSIGALFGTSNVTTFVESAAGIGAGGRTGLTSVIVALLFLLCLPFAGLFAIVPTQATAPALIVVGVMMMSSFKEINWSDFEVAAPAFLTVVFMIFAYSISYGIAAGFIFYCIIKICTGKAKEVHPILWFATLFFIVNFVILALQ